MAEDKHTTPLSQQEEISGPLKRMNAFLRERSKLIDTAADTGTRSRSLGRESANNKEADEGKAQSSAAWVAHRMSQLRTYRERVRKEEDEQKNQAQSRAIIQAPPQNNWIPIGPTAMRQGQAATRPVVSGRVQGYAISPGGDRLYVATANGGVWRSTDHGLNWVSLMDRTADGYSFDLDPSGNDPLAPVTTRADSLACGAIVVDFGATIAEDKIYVGTGEGHMAAMLVLDPDRLFLLFGVGPVVSTDGGLSWQTESASTPATTLVSSGFYQMAIDPNQKDRIVAATTAGLYRREEIGATGTYHWVQKTPPGATDHPSSLVVAESGGTTTFFTAYRDGRIYSSNDGDVWNQMGGQLPGLPNLERRITLAVHPDRPQVVYAYRGDSTVLRWEDGDNSWVNVAGIPAKANLAAGQGFYDLSIAVSPETNNSDRIYLGGATVYANPSGNVVSPPPHPPGYQWSAALYRCDLAITRVGGNITAVNATFTYIGASVHADVHVIMFEPNNPNKLWVGCDGGVFYSPNPLGSGSIFEAKNDGLQTLTMNHFAQHPEEDAFIVSGTQDNGSVRYTGEGLWESSFGGDAGYIVIDWKTPYNVLMTYIGSTVYRSTNAGNRNTYFNASVPLIAGDNALFYAPLIGSPPAHLKVPAAPPPPDADAQVVAFGGRAPYISRDFGSNWSAIPTGTVGGLLADEIRSLVFANVNKLYAGLMDGKVYRFDFVSAPNNWNATRIDNAAAAPVANENPLSAAVVGPITSIIVDPSDNTGNSIFLTIGGLGDWRHVWHFDGSDWQHRSGGTLNNTTRLLDVQHSTLAIDTDSATNDLYVGADIGVWKSVDNGQNWNPMSSGLPDAAVMDLKILPQRLDGATVVRPPILRASTQGRGVWERTLDTVNKFGVELYLRDTLLDTGRYTTPNTADDPTDNSPGTLNFNEAISIKVDSPNNAGLYQYSANLGRGLTTSEFVDKLEDKSTTVATHDTAVITSKVYVQVHNRGVLPANGVQVTLLLSPTNGRQDLPANYEADIQAGNPINANGWVTVGVKTVDNVRAAQPSVVAFDLLSSHLPTASALAGNEAWQLLALLHHPDDPFGDAARGGVTLVDVDPLTQQSRHTTQKPITVTAFAGTIPGSGANIPLAGYIEIPESATTAEAPFDYFLADALRINDGFFAKMLSAISVAPLAHSGYLENERTLTDPSPIAFVQADEITVENDISLTNGTPLIWRASTKITLGAKLDASGKGSQLGQKGDFGGSGGGGSAGGEDTQFPFTQKLIQSGGNLGGVGNALPESLVNRLLASLAFCKGGAAGGGDNPGTGGGIVCLYAPVIEFDGGSIDVQGADGGAGNSGGGGGGTLILMADTIEGLEQSGANQNVFFAGGNGSGGGGNGGNGNLLVIANNQI